MWPSDGRTRPYEAYRARGVSRDGRRFGGDRPSPYQVAETPAGKINTTDPNSRLLKAAGGYVQGDNAQVAVNERQIVLAAEITKDSADETVKAGIDVQHVMSKPVRNDDFTHDLGRKTFLIFLTQGKNAKHSLDLAADYTPMTPDDRKRREEHFKKNIVAEGGVDLQTIDRRRGSQSVGFVGTAWPLKELKKRGGGAESAGNVLADVILHELGHALGHNDVIGTMDHDTSGIMTATVVLDSQPYKSQQYSTASAQLIRGRLEELAGRLRPRRP